MRHNYDKQADRKIILGPIFKYAAIGITIGVVMLTGIVTLERHNNTLDQDLADLKAQLARASEEAPDSAPNSAGAEGEQEASSQIETPSTGPSTQSISITNTIADSSAATGQKPTDYLMDSTQAEESSPITNQTVTAHQPDIAETRDEADVSDFDEVLITTAPGVETFEYKRPERLSHREWAEQQHLQHQQWLEEVEQRSKNEFDTRKALQQGNRINTIYDGRESI